MSSRRGRPHDQHSLEGKHKLPVPTQASSQKTKNPPKDALSLPQFPGSTFILHCAAGCCTHTAPSVLHLSRYTPSCRLISSCLYFLTFSLVIYSCLLFRFQPLGSHKIRYLCSSKACLTKNRMCANPLLQVLQTKCNQRG